MKAELGTTPKTPPSLMSKLIRGLGGMVISAIFAGLIVFAAAIQAALFIYGPYTLVMLVFSIGEVSLGELAISFGLTGLGCLFLVKTNWAKMFRIAAKTVEIPQSGQPDQDNPPY